MNDLREIVWRYFGVEKICRILGSNGDIESFPLKPDHDTPSALYIWFLVIVGRNKEYVTFFHYAAQSPYNLFAIFIAAIFLQHGFQKKSFIFQKLGCKKFQRKGFWNDPKTKFRCW